MIRCVRFPSVLALAAVVLGCSTLQSLDRYPQDKVRLMNAAQKVLARHFTVTGVDWPHGVVEARSETGANLAAKYRTRAVAHVFRLRSGAYDCEIRVTNELEVSEASHQGGAQPPYDWRAAGFDKPLEARLMAELRAELAGPGTVAAAPSRSYFMFRPPTKAPFRHRDLFRPHIPDLQPQPGTSESKAPPPAAPRPPRPEPVARPAPQAQETQAAEPPATPAGNDLYDQYVALGDRYLGRGEHDKALLEYQRAAFAQPQSAAPHLALAAVWAALDRYPAAAESLRQAAEAAAGQAPAADIRRLRSLRPDLTQRLLLLKGWVKTHPADTDARLVLGYHCLLANRADEARQALRGVLDAQPREPAARYLMQLL